MQPNYTYTDTDIDLFANPSASALATTSDNRWRAMLFQLNDEGAWDELGTGYSQVVKDNEEYYVRVISENDAEEVLINSKIILDRLYQRQRDTIITWQEDEPSVDLALSFQDSDGAQETWQLLCNVQGRDPEEASHQSEFTMDDEILPTPTFKTLPTIAEELHGIIPMSKKGKISSCVLNDDAAFLKKLADLFNTAEDLDQREYCVMLFAIYKSLLFLGDTKIIEALLSDRFYISTFGTLEYDPEGDRTQNNNKHRQFLLDKVKFKKILNIDEVAVIDKIHLNYRLTYLKESAQGHTIDEPNTANINSLIYMNNLDIVQHVFSSKSLINELFEKMRSDNQQEKFDAIGFFLEICQISKGMQLQSRFAFFESLPKHNFFDIVSEILAMKNSPGDIKDLKEEEQNKENIAILQAPPKHEEYDINIIDLLKINATELLVNCLQIIPLQLKGYLLSDEEKAKDYKMLNLICDELMSNKEIGIKMQMSELLRTLLDNESVEYKNEFYEVFYDKLLKKLVSYLTVNTPLNDYETTESINFAKNLILELIIMCTKFHGLKMRYFIIQNNLIIKIFELIQLNVKHLNIFIVKFFRTVLGNKDDYLSKHIVENNLYDPIVTLYKENVNKTNLLHSVLLELFEFIRKDNVKRAIMYLAAYHKEFLEATNDHGCFKAILQKNEQYIDVSSSRLSETAKTALGKEPYGWNKVKDDEDYFKDSDEDEDELFNQQQYLRSKQLSDFKNGVAGIFKPLDVPSDTIALGVAASPKQKSPRIDISIGGNNKSLSMSEENDITIRDKVEEKKKFETGIGLVKRQASSKLVNYDDDDDEDDEEGEKYKKYTNYADSLKKKKLDDGSASVIYKDDKGITHDMVTVEESGEEKAEEEKTEEMKTNEEKMEEI